MVPETDRPPTALQSDRLANPLYDLICYFVRALGATPENVVDVRFVGQDFFAAFAHRGEIFPKLLEKLFLEIAVTGTAFLESFAHASDFAF